MIDPHLLRENSEAITALKRRHINPELIDSFLAIDSEWRSKRRELESCQNQRNELTPKGKPTDEQRDALKALSAKVKNLQEEVSLLEEKKANAALMIPNVPASDIPDGEDESGNECIQTVGDVPSFSFQPKPHEDLATNLGLVDFESGVKLAGSRFVAYKGVGAQLERALINLMLDTHTQKHGYTEVMPPHVVNSQCLTGTGQLPKFAEDCFKIEDTDLWLSPTAEVQLTNLFQNQVLQESDLPLKVTAHTACYRKEAGSYGKDVKGLIRLHQFNKVELVQLVTPENAEQGLLELRSHAEYILQLLGLPYRVVTLCAGDLGFSAAKTFDLEVWFPSQGQYREISSCSHFTDFQSRRAMIRYKNGSIEKPRYVHTLNGSGLAVGRVFAAILENYQDESGNIKVPTVLKKYMNMEKIDCPKITTNH